MTEFSCLRHNSTRERDPTKVGRIKLLSSRKEKRGGRDLEKIKLVIHLCNNMYKKSKKIQLVNNYTSLII